MSLDKANRMAGTRYRFLINVPKGEEGGKAAEATPMRMFNANITSTPGVISVFSDVKLNANGANLRITVPPRISAELSVIPSPVCLTTQTYPPTAASSSSAGQGLPTRRTQ